MTEQGLNYLIDRAEKTRNAAGIRLAKARNAEQQAEQQKDVLQSYRNEYRERMAKALTEGAPAEVVRDYQLFLSSLEQAIEDAKQHLERQHKKVTESFQSMKTHQMQLSSFTALAERRHQVKAQAEQKQEAKTHDDLANQMYLRQRAAGESLPLDRDASYE